MNKPSTIEMLKYIGGGAIVVTAFLIMMPGFAYEAMRFGNVLLLIGIALSLALVVVLVRNKLLGSKKSPLQAAGGPAAPEQAEQSAES